MRVYSQNGPESRLAAYIYIFISLLVSVRYYDASEFILWCHNFLGVARELYGFALRGVSPKVEHLKFFIMVEG